MKKNKKKKNLKFSMNKMPDYDIDALPKLFLPNDKSLCQRLAIAVDRIEAQILRLENL